MLEARPGPRTIPPVETFCATHLAVIGLLEQLHGALREQKHVGADDVLIGLEVPVGGGH